MNGFNYPIATGHLNRRFIITLTESQLELLKAQGFILNDRDVVNFYYLPIGFVPTHDANKFEIVDLEDFPQVIKEYIKTQLK